MHGKCKLTLVCSHVFKTHHPANKLDITQQTQVLDHQWTEEKKTSVQNSNLKTIWTNLPRQLEKWDA